MPLAMHGPGAIATILGMTSTVSWDDFDRCLAGVYLCKFSNLLA